MKILHITGMRSTKNGGLERFFAALAKSDASDRHLFAYKQMPESEAFISWVGRENLFTFKAELSSGIRLIPDFVILIKKTRPDAIHFHFGNAYGVLTLVARLMGIKRIYKTQHSCVYQNGRQVYSFKNLSLMAKVYTLAGNAFNMMTAVLPVSKAVTEQMSSIFGKKPIFVTAYLGVGDLFSDDFQQCANRTVRGG